MCRYIFITSLFVLALSTQAEDLTSEQRLAIESRIKPMGKVCLLGQTDCGSNLIATVSGGDIGLQSSDEKASSSAVGCSFDIEVGDSLQFSMEAMSVSASCKDITVNLRHTGNMPVSAMGHNWVLTKNSDSAGVALDGVDAGMDNDYVKPEDARVIAYTPLIGGGESTSITFSFDRLDSNSEYIFFCSFPGHSYVMRGVLKIA